MNKYKQNECEMNCASVICKLDYVIGARVNAHTCARMLDKFDRLSFVFEYSIESVQFPLFLSLSSFNDYRRTRARAAYIAKATQSKASIASLGPSSSCLNARIASKLTKNRSMSDNAQVTECLIVNDYHRRVKMKRNKRA